MKIGIDVVEIKRISKIISESSEFINKILYPKEMEPWNIQSICGKIAAKEAVIKTGYILVGQWKKIMILSSDGGEPQVFDENKVLVSKLYVSISHTSNLAIAMAVYEK